MDKPEEIISPEQLSALALQLQKDFMMFNVNFLIETIETRYDLSRLVAEQCNDLLQSNPKKLTQIIYRIDLFEKKVSSAFLSEKESNKGLLLAELMIDRTLQKVKLKELLNSHEEKNKKLSD